MKNKLANELAVAACYCIFAAGIVYAIVTLLGFLALPSPLEPIPNPYFTIMEILIVVIAPLMLVGMLGLHKKAGRPHRTSSLAATICMFVAAVLTTAVHLTILIRGTAGSPVSSAMRFFSFRSPSILYLLDIIAWDGFFALSLLIAAFIIKPSKSVQITRVLMFLAGGLSFAGLLGLPLGNLFLRNMGIIGYAVFGPFAFLFIGRYLRCR